MATSRVDGPLPPDTRVGNFKIKRLLGEGAMGEVYLALDLVLGRRVALKLIKVAALDDSATERFLEEARTTASFNHPHIVTIHAFGEHDGRPYLALEFVDGESLRERLQRGPLPLREALGHCLSVADAIAEAHRSGLVHADLKPENIVIARDGRIRLVDFGLAKMIGARPGAGSGTPAYMAPERWRIDAPTGALDVWAIGITLHELVTGKRPISDDALMHVAYSRGPLPLQLPIAPWADLVRRCLEIDPSARPSTEQLIETLRSLLEERLEPDRTRCPFPGLASFSSENARDFFGRSEELAAALERLHQGVVVPIIGPSGVGKSSFVRAALIPYLNAEGWNVVSFRPGNAPFRELGRVLEVDDTALRTHPGALAVQLERLAEKHTRRSLIFIDQFEETFTLNSTEDALAFCDSIANALESADRWRIVLTMREDFLGRMAAVPSFRVHLANLLSVSNLSRDDLRDAIVGPLRNLGYAADDPELVSRIVDDVAGQPACLPLLQFACRALWERRDEKNRKILVREYDAMGGATGALAAHAERVLASLTNEQIKNVRTIFLALIDARGTRRPRLESELLVLAPDAKPLVDILLENRLLVMLRDNEDTGHVEVAHEALSTAWPRLARWLDETVEQRRLVTELEQAADLWERRGRHDEETWRGAALADASRKITTWGIAISRPSQAFIAASRARENRATRRRRWIVGAVGATLSAIAIGGVAAAIAFSRKEQEAIAQQAEIRLASADMGRFQLEIEPFDWDPMRQVASPPAMHPSFTWTLRTVDVDDVQLPGHEYGPSDFKHGDPLWAGSKLVEIVEARSGPAFLEVQRKGCPPSLIRMQRVPGFTERTDPVRRIAIRVPTCQASSVDMIEARGGDFYAAYMVDDDLGTTRDELRNLDTFSIDRTEVTRGAFNIYAAMAGVTGDRSAPLEYLKLDRRGGEWLPVVGVSYFVARNYCAFLGKSLPSFEQWQRAFRGGLMIRGAPNPDPTRKQVWGPWFSGRLTNLLPAVGDGAPIEVASSPLDASPEGIRDLAGNVAEWTTSPSQFGLRTVLGGGWTSPERGAFINWQNARPDMSVPYDVGIRCISTVASAAATR